MTILLVASWAFLLRGLLDIQHDLDILDVAAFTLWLLSVLSILFS